MSFSDLVGKNILIVSKLLSSDETPVEVKLVGTEAGGLWIEHEELAKKFAAAVIDQALRAALPSTRKQIVCKSNPSFFLPFHAIDLVLSRETGLVAQVENIGGEYTPE